MTTYTETGSPTVGHDGLVAERRDYLDDERDPHWHVTEHATGRELARYPALGLDGLGAIRRYQRQREAARREAGSE